MHEKFQAGHQLITKALAAFEAVKRGAPGLPGRHGHDGNHGRSVTQVEVESAVRKFLKQPKDGESPTPELVANVLLQHKGFHKLIEKNLKPGKNGESPAPDSIVSMVMDELGKRKISIADIEGLDAKFNEMRGHVNASKEWRGGGDTVVAGAGVTITNTVNGNKRITATGSLGYQVPTGTVDGNNKIFVFSSAPNVIVVDQGRPMQKVSSDGTVNWTGTTTVTLAIAPTSDIFSTA